MQTVDVTVGGASGAYGRAFVWAPAYGLGMMFDDLNDVEQVTTNLLTTIALRLNEPCQLGSITTKTRVLPQGEYLVDGERVAGPVKVKAKRKTARKRRTMEEYSSMPGFDED